MTPAICQPWLWTTAIICIPNSPPVIEVWIKRSCIWMEQREKVYECAWLVFTYTRTWVAQISASHSDIFHCPVIITQRLPKIYIAGSIAADFYSTSDGLTSFTTYDQSYLPEIWTVWRIALNIGRIKPTAVAQQLSFDNFFCLLSILDAAQPNRSRLNRRPRGIRSNCAHAKNRIIMASRHLVSQRKPPALR